MPTTTRADRPRLVGDGPATCSTCTSLVRQPEFIADVNGYYRDLGVDPRASRVQIKRAYLARGTGDVRLTFVVKQLLDPVVRRAYDLTPLGHVFFDRYVLASVRRSAALRATRGAGEDGATPDTPSEVVLDTTGSAEQGVSRTTEWPYSFYLWGTDREDKKMLAELQERLVAHLSKAQQIHQVAVGLRGGMAPPVETTVVGRRVVVFLHEDEALTDALVVQAASSPHLSPADHT